MFNGLERKFEVGRYHSWVVDTDLPDELEATSFDENGQIMSLRHKKYDVKGMEEVFVQLARKAKRSDN